MDKFLALTEEKQTTIRNAALACFAKHGYEKASINDITVAAGFYLPVFWNEAGPLRVPVLLLLITNEASIRSEHLRCKRRLF